MTSTKLSMTWVRVALAVDLLSISIFLSSCSTPTPPIPSGPDSTSHIFTWHFDTLGEGNSSVLYDVAIIDDSTVWAVGAIFLRDSVGQLDPTLYNIAKWNGRVWVFDRGPLSPFRAIIAFGSNDVWAGTSAPYHWNGSSWQGYNVSGIFNGTILRMWGSSSQNVFIVGSNGSIARFDGSNWQKIESGVSIDIRDVWGSKQGQQTDVIAVASTGIGFPQSRFVLRVGNISATPLDSSELPLALETVWFLPSQVYYLAGNGVLTSPTPDGAWTADSRIQSFYNFSLRGLASNDIVTVGGFGGIAHFNGSSWKVYTGKETPWFDENYYGVAIHPRIVVAVGGYDSQKASVLIGKR